MATTCILYSPLTEKTDDLFTQAPAQPLQNATATQNGVQTTFTDTNVRETLQDLTDVARNFPTEEALRLEIEKLSTATLTIDKAFRDIKSKLSDATKEQNQPPDLRKTCRTLKTKWDEHYLTFKGLLWRSRDFAGEAQAAVDEFRELVLPSLRDQNRSDSQKEEIIREQITALREVSQPSQGLCDEFLDFGKVLETDITEFSRIIENFEIDKLSKRVGVLELKLDAARIAMGTASREMKNLGWKFAKDVAVTGIVLLLGFVVPTWWAQLAVGVAASAMGIGWMALIKSGPQFLDAWKRHDVAVKRYTAIKSEYDPESACLSQALKLESALHDSQPLIQEVTMKLGIFASVWAAIAADTRKLQNSLQRAKNSRSQLFIDRVQRLERLYGCFSQALHHYQVAVQLPQ